MGYCGLVAWFSEFTPSGTEIRSSECIEQWMWLYNWFHSSSTSSWLKSWTLLLYHEWNGIQGKNLFVNDFGGKKNSYTLKVTTILSKCKYFYGRRNIIACTISIVLKIDYWMFHTTEFGFVSKTFVLIN